MRKPLKLVNLKVKPSNLSVIFWDLCDFQKKLIKTEIKIPPTKSQNFNQQERW